MLTREELEDTLLTLENDSRFYAWCGDKLQTCTEMHWINALGYYYPLAKRLCPAQVIYLRRYFNWRYLQNQVGAPPEYAGPWKRPVDQPRQRVNYNKEFREQYGQDLYAPAPADPNVQIKQFLDTTPLKMDYTMKSDKWNGQPLTVHQPEFNPMTSLNFKTVFTINGHDLSKLSNEDVYAAIQAEEARIEKMKTIKNQPKSLKAEIAAAEAQLAKLIEHLDSQA